MSIYAPQISRGMARNRTRASKVRGPRFKGRKSKNRDIFLLKTLAYIVIKLLQRVNVKSGFYLYNMVDKQVRKHKYA